MTSEEEADRALRKAIEDHGPIDCVVNNAGITNDRNYKQEIDINFVSIQYYFLNVSKGLSNSQ